MIGSVFDLFSSYTSSVHFESGSGFYPFESVSGFYQTSPGLDLIHFESGSRSGFYQGSQEGESGSGFYQLLSPDPDFINRFRVWILSSMSGSGSASGSGFYKHQ